MTKIHWMLVTMMVYLWLIFPPWLAFKPGIMGTDINPGQQVMLCALASFLIGAIAFVTVLSARRIFKVGDRDLRRAVYDGFAGKALRCTVVILGFAGMAMTAVGIALIVGCVLADIFGASREFISPMYTFGLLLLSTGAWPYIMARHLFPYGFPEDFL